MAKYRKKPVEVEAEFVRDLINAFSHNWNALPKWVAEAYEKTIITAITGNGFIVKTLEGNMQATVYDMLVKGIEGEIYPCKIDIFNKTYDRVIGDE